jgi:hypothetical protein
MKGPLKPNEAMMLVFSSEMQEIQRRIELLQTWVSVAESFYEVELFDAAKSRDLLQEKIRNAVTTNKTLKQLLSNIGFDNTLQ